MIQYYQVTIQCQSKNLEDKTFNSVQHFMVCKSICKNIPLNVKYFSNKIK